MGGRMPASWWRDYRRRRSQELRAYNRARRATPAARAQRHAQEARRRSRHALEAQAPLPALHTGHPLLEAARALVPEVRPGGALTWWREALAQDLASEATLALLEGRDPEVAVAAYRAREHAWARLTGPALAAES